MRDTQSVSNRGTQSETTFNRYCFDEDRAVAYFESMRDELDFLWRDALSQEDDDLKERKLKQFWEMYRLYRVYRDSAQI